MSRELSFWKYRVSHSDMDFFKWLWGVERLRILMTYLWLHGHEGYPFVFHHPVFKKVASAGLNSLLLLHSEPFIFYASTGLSRWVGSERLRDIRVPGFSVHTFSPGHFSLDGLVKFSIPDFSGLECVDWKVEDSKCPSTFWNLPLFAY